MGRRGGTISAVSGDGSAILWQFPTAMPNLSGVAVANNVVYFQSLDGFLYALDSRHGRQLARVQTPICLAPCAFSPVRGQLGLGRVVRRPLRRKSVRVLDIPDGSDSDAAVRAAFVDDRGQIVHSASRP